MNASENRPDELQKVWQEDPTDSKGADVPMTIQLLREKHRSLRDLIWGQDLAEYVLALAFAPLTALAAWTAKASIVQAGYVIMTLMLLASTAIIWISERGIRRYPHLDVSALEFHRRLIESYERRIRFLKSVKFWYAIPLFFGASLVLLPILRHALPGPWGIVTLYGLLLIAWLGVWHMNDVRRVGELRRRRDDVQGLLDRMNAE
ncbi:MAG: hypothetical protein KIT09_13930 [Bryobacteraceae bacterium]|nr:hypothetical protein [Bryobacteraceae bacterium]